MRDSKENIAQLQRRLNDLQSENRILKKILDKAGVPYRKELSNLQNMDIDEAYEEDQGKRIIHPKEITENMANLFFSRFWGRQDVYAKRSENKATGKAGYHPQCNHFWADICHRKMNRAIGTSNYDTPRWIYLGKDHLSGYIQIPRGLYDELIKSASQAEIRCEIEDERQSGRSIRMTFNGKLRPGQEKALKELTKHDNGILHAATAFGKTVVSSAVIAQKKVNALIIPESSALMEQWKEALDKFLDIDEELPTYETKSGRIKKRKSLIGTLQGAQDSMTGIVDIAMAGSLLKKGEYHKLLNQYGLVIIDECHHSASETIANVLKAVKANNRNNKQKG